MTVTATESPGQAFASLMSGAAQAVAPAADPEAPFGWTTDAATGERRPKKAPGRPRKSPSLDELKAAKAETEEAGEAAAPEEDRAPQQSRRRPGGHTHDQADSVAPYVPGVIAKGVNRLYRRAGKIIRAMDYDIGQAVIECTRKEDKDDLSVGEAWEALAKGNPRIRAFLLKAMAGGSWTELVMAHAPIGVAIVMKPAIMRLVLPGPGPDGEPREPGFIGRAVTSWMEPDEDTTAEDLELADVEQMADLAASQMQRMAGRMTQGMTPEQKRAAERAMSRIGNGLAPGNDPDIPPALRRQQPKNRSRSQRRK